MEDNTMSKRLILICSLLMLGFAANAQAVFTVVAADSDDGFVNVRTEPSMKGKIVAELHLGLYGLGGGILIEKNGSWSKVRVGDAIGWCYNKYLWEQTWYSNNGNPVLVAKNDRTPIYRDHGGEIDEDEGYPVFALVKRGTIIADQYRDGDEYYILPTAHDELLVKKSDVIVR